MDSKRNTNNNSIEFEKLTYTASLLKSETKQILKKISGVFKCGELTAIMGPSGAGKSSLMNILTGFTRQGIGGQVHMNNVQILSATYGKDCSYILQDDNLFLDFSVQETMMIAADLKIGAVTTKKKQQIIDSVLKSLQLQHTKETRCGELSGGQRKRLSIALELLDNRPVLFLDEPTSGLDSLSAAQCVRLLHNLAHEGRIIVCTIHQPEALVYEQFDHVYVLADGECMYQGSAANTVRYLHASIGLQCPQYHNPADFLLEVVNSEYGNYRMQLAQTAVDKRWRIADGVQSIAKSNGIAASFHQLKMIESLEIDLSADHVQYGEDVRYDIPSEWSRFFVLIGRCRVHCHRDWTVTYLKWGCHVLTGIFMALIFGDSGSNATKAIANLAMILANVMYVWYTAIMPSVLKFPSEFAIIKKETFNNWYSLRTYFLANMVVATPIQIIFSITLSTLVYWFTDQPFELERFLKFSFVFITINILADAVGLIVGAIFDPVNGTFIGAVLTIFNIALAGILAMRSQVFEPIKIAMDMMPMHYSVEALVLSLYDKDRGDMMCPATEIYCHYKSPKLLIQELGARESNFEYDISIMIVQVIALKFIAYFTMRKRIKSGS